MPGQQVIQGHADCIEILLRGRHFTAKRFRCNETWRSGQGRRLVFGQSGAVGEPEIQQAQLTVVPQQQVLRFDVAVQNLPPMQHADRSKQAFGEVLPLRQRHWPDLFMQLRQGRSGIFAHHVVQVLALTGGMNFRKMPPGHALEKPFLRQQGLPRLMIVMQAAGQGFQQPGLLLGVTHPIEQ
ncbi:hypothetical protein D3C87_1169620 [compost metagenome]